jgi:hypothetical protein
MTDDDLISVFARRAERSTDRPTTAAESSARPVALILSDPAMNRPFNTSQIRFRVDPADVPLEKAARRLHLTSQRFRELLPELIARGFPKPDPDTGNFDLDAIDLWRRSRHRTLTALTAETQQPDPLHTRMGEKFREAQKRKRHDPVA